MHSFETLIRQGKVLYIGTRKLAQLEDNLASLNVELNTEQLRKLDEVSRVELGFPHEFYEREMISNFVYAGLADHIERA